jgi:predicted HTH transcriptional regulator
MNKTLIFIIVLITGIILGVIWGSWKKRKKLGGQNNLISGQVKTKIENKEKILEFLKSNEKITNDQAQELLSISDATAERYLDELEKEDKIKQIGKTGNAVYYQLV